MGLLSLKSKNVNKVIIKPDDLNKSNITLNQPPSSGKILITDIDIDKGEYLFNETPDEIEKINQELARRHESKFNNNDNIRLNEKVKRGKQALLIDENPKFNPNSNRIQVTLNTRAVKCPSCKTLLTFANQDEVECHGIIYYK
jgi:hypothetical protein